MQTPLRRHLLYTKYLLDQVNPGRLSTLMMRAPIEELAKNFRVSARWWSSDWRTWLIARLEGRAMSSCFTATRLREAMRASPYFLDFLGDQDDADFI